MNSKNCRSFSRSTTAAKQFRLVLSSTKKGRGQLGDAGQGAAGSRLPLLTVQRLCAQRSVSGTRRRARERHQGRVERPVYSSVLLSSLRTEPAQLPPGHKLWSWSKPAPQLRSVRLWRFYFSCDSKAAADNRTVLVSPGDIWLPPIAA